MDNKIDKKISKEKKVVKLMIMKYCKGHNHVGTPCVDCNELIEYVERRIERCPFMETKIYCSNCKRNCYNSNMRERIREVMRYSGPRMILSHPVLTMDYVYQGVKHNIKEKNKEKELHK